MRRVAYVVGGLLIAWLVTLWIVDSVYASGYGERVGGRVGESLGGRATVAVTDLALVRGFVEMDQLHVTRDDSVGKLTLDVDAVRCDVAPFGWALFDNSVDVLTVRGVRLDASSDKVFHVQNPKRAPIHARRTVIDDARMTMSLPPLGKIAIRVEHAEVGDTVYRTPLSWLFALVELRASVELPARITVAIAYKDGKLTGSGTLFGKSTVTVPIVLPPASTFPDARAEIHGLVVLGQDVAEKLVAKRATDWLDSKLSR